MIQISHHAKGISSDSRQCELGAFGAECDATLGSHPPGVNPGIQTAATGSRDRGDSYLLLHGQCVSYHPGLRT